ncbi:MAG: HAD family hydrolase [Planctomycetota bacterium]
MIIDYWSLIIVADKKIKAVLFDLGETLVNFGKVSRLRVFRQGARGSYDFLKSCGQPVGNFEYYCWKNLILLHICRWFSYITGNDFDALELLSRVGARNGIELDEQQWEHFTWLWYEPLSRVGKVEPDIVETLTALKELGLKLGIVSNTFVHGSSLEKHLEQLGILDFFAVRVYSYQFDFRKPDARIFIKAVDKIDERLPNTLFVGDRINKDIKPALMLDMPAVLKDAYTNASRKVPKGVWKINKLAELPALIKKNNHIKKKLTMENTKNSKEIRN